MCQVLALSSDQPLTAQRAALVSCPHVVVSTPSRARQLIEAQALSISAGLQFLVLDEADLLLSCVTRKHTHTHTLASPTSITPT